MGMPQLNYSLKTAAHSKDEALKKADKQRRAENGSVDILINGQWIPLSDANA